MDEKDELAQNIKAATQRYTQLLERSRGAFGERPHVDAEALQELSLSLEELSVAQEELRVQNQALRDAYYQVDEARQHYQDLFALVPDSYIVTDAYGSVLDANNAAEEMLQASSERLRGKPLTVFVAEEDRRTFRSFLTRARESLAILEANVLITPRGKGTPIRVAVRAVRIKDENTHQRIAWMIRDITEKQRAATLGVRFSEEQNARIDAERSARRFRMLADVSRNLDVETDTETMCRNVVRSIIKALGDHAEILLLEGTELRSAARVNREARHAAFSDALRRRHHMTPEKRDSRLWQAIETNEPQIAPLREGESAFQSRKELFDAMRKSGPRNAVAVPLSHMNRALGVLVVLSTEQTPQLSVEDVGLLLEVATRVGLVIANAQLVQDLAQANREKVDFLAVLSHELRTPLAAVIGYSDLLLSGIPNPVSDRARENVERIRACSWHQLRVVEQILQFATTDANADKLAVMEFEISAVMHEVMEIVEQLAADKNLTLEMDLPPGELRLRTDAGRVRQVLVNLMSNAIKFTDLGTITLGMRRSDDAAFITVSDTGVGIRAEDLNRVFDPFWRAPQSGSVPVTGMGLGLAISTRLARSIGCEITVQSQVGVGTTFTLRVPLS